MNSPYRILITGVSGDIGYSCVRALSQEDCYLLYGIDISPLCPVTNLLDSFTLVPPVTSNLYLQKIFSLIDLYNIDIILPTSEAEILFFNKNRQYFKNTKCSLAINNKNIIDCFSNKYETAIFIKKLGFNAPSTYGLKDFHFEIPFPLIVKPMHGSGSSHVYLIHDKQEFDRINTDKTPYLVQEYLPGEDQEYTSTIFSDGTTTTSITFRRILKNGISHFVELVDSPDIKAMGKKIASAIQLYGSINIQTRKVNGEHFVFEINPRLSSTIFFRNMVGFKDAHWWIQTLLGNKIPSFSLTRSSFRGLRYLTEVCLEG